MIRVPAFGIVNNGGYVRVLPPRQRVRVDAKAAPSYSTSLETEKRYERGYASRAG